jgi:hypothetical protein
MCCHENSKVRAQLQRRRRYQRTQKALPESNAEGVRQFQPRVELATTLGTVRIFIRNAESVDQSRQRLRRSFFTSWLTQGCANPGLTLANAFGVSLQLTPAMPATLVLQFTLATPATLFR